MSFIPKQGNQELLQDPQTKAWYNVFGYTEFIDFCNTTERHPDSETSSEKTDSGENPWCGTDTWQTAVDYAKHGWEAGLQKIQDYIETDATIINVEHNIVGHAVDVGRFLMGVPDTMIAFHDDSYRNKAPLTLYVKLTYTSEISGEQAMEYCYKILETVALLNRTFNVKLVGVFWTKHDKIDDSMVLVNIKDTDERFVLNSLAFAFNPAFFRRFWFKWYETTNFFQWGYGSSPRGGFGQGKNKEALENIQEEHQMVQFVPDIYDSKNFNPTEFVAQIVKEVKE